MPVPQHGPEPQTYTLRVPVDLPPTLRIEGEAEGDIGGLKLSIRNHGEGRLEIRLDGFPSEEAAGEGFEALKGWLAWTTVELKHGLRFSRELQPIVWRESPPPTDHLLQNVDGLADRGPVIHATAARVNLAGVGDVQAYTTPSASTLLGYLADAATVGAATPEGDERLVAAADLYAAASWEGSNYARFLTLVNVLEALKDQPRLGEGVQHLIDGWLSELDEATEAGDVLQEEAGSLRGSLGHLRKRGIGASVRQLVADHLSEPDLAKEAKKIYDERSKLVHDGLVPPQLAAHVGVLMDLVPRLLREVLVRPRTEGQ